VDVFDLLRVSFIGKGRGCRLPSPAWPKWRRGPGIFLEPFDLAKVSASLLRGTVHLPVSLSEKPGNSRQGGPTGAVRRRTRRRFRLVYLVRMNSSRIFRTPCASSATTAGCPSTSIKRRRPFHGEADLHVVFDAVDRHPVHDFKGRRDDSRGDDPRYRLARGADIPEIGKEGALFLRREISRTVTSVMIRGSLRFRQEDRGGIAATSFTHFPPV